MLEGKKITPRNMPDEALQPLSTAYISFKMTCQKTVLVQSCPHSNREAAAGGRRIKDDGRGFENAGGCASFSLKVWESTAEEVSEYHLHHLGEKNWAACSACLKVTMNHTEKCKKKKIWLLDSE